MKATLTLMSLAVFFTSLALSTFPVHSSILPSIIDSGNIVDQTCRQTPYYHLCQWTLRSNPRSHNANARELARIMVGTLDSRATITLHHIRELLRSGVEQSSTQQALHSCAERYRVIVRRDVPEASEAISKGDYKSAERGTFDAATEARSCERGFSRGSSPLSEQNKLVHDTSLVAAAIVKAITRAGSTRV